MSKRQRERHKEIREFWRWEKAVFQANRSLVFPQVKLDETEQGLLKRRERERLEVLRFFGIPLELLH